MRSKKDVDNLVEVIRIALQANPHQRLCQLIVNATGVNDPFYVTDEKLTQNLKDYVKLINKKET